MRDKLWINRWTERRKESAVSNAKQGISFLGGYNMTDYKNVLFELCVGLNMYKGSPTSCYSNIIPPNGSEVIKVRLSDHRSTENEWGQNELTGYPNRRYSIVIFSMKSMPDESKQDIVETEWLSYLSNGIPVYEKCFNRYYLKDTFPKLISILQDIYSGGAPEDNTIRVDLTENKQHKTRYNMKKTIRLSESDLHRVIKESVQTILKESNITPNLEQEMERNRDNPNRFMHTLNAYGMRYESILKDAEKMGLDDIAEIAKQRLHQISDEMIKAREQWNFHA